MKVILHIDMDSYFVSAARVVDPSLIGKPVGISIKKRRSIITAASYEAKRKGIYVPMPYYKAIEICPNLIIVKPDFALYTNLSRKVFELLSKKYTKKIEVASIDECYMDATDLIKKYKTPINLAKDIQQTILKELKIPLSIGISNNKFVAKMSTGINKPLGITVTKPGDFLKVFGGWEVNKFFGIGNSTATKLNKIGIKTISDLANYNLEKLKMHLGSISSNLISHANGHGSDKILLERNELKSIGNSITFMDKDRSSRKEILEMISQMCQLVSHRANNRNLVGSIVSLSIKEKGGLEIKPKRKQVTLSVPINSYERIYEESINLFSSLWKGEIIKFVGVSLNNLSNIFDIDIQSSIFEKNYNKSESQKIIDKINNKFKSKVLMTGYEGMKQNYLKQNQSKYIETDKLLKRNK